MWRYEREKRGGGQGKTWCEDYGEVVLYLSVRKGEMHEYVTREDLDTATSDEKGNVTIFIHEGAYAPEDYDHYLDFSYAVYVHTRRYEVTMPIEVLRDRAMRGLLQYRAAYRELTPRDRYPSFPAWLLENKRQVTTRDEGGKRVVLSLESEERIPVSAPRKTIYDPLVSVDLFHRIHAVYADGCLWPNLFFNPIQFWDMLIERSTGRERYSGQDPFTAEAELIPIDPSVKLTNELLVSEPSDHSWFYGDMCDYLALSNVAHLWGIDIVCLGSGILPSWFDRTGDCKPPTTLDCAENFIIFGEEYPGARSARFVRVGTSFASHRDPTRSCFLLKMHNRVTKRR